jgi:hypothetical protein
MANMPWVECPRCGRRTRAYAPRGGDGSKLITSRHKDLRGGPEQCHAEVDVAAYADDDGEVERYLARREVERSYTDAARTIK